MKIFTGFDHYNHKPLYQVIGLDYVGEWHTEKVDAENELSELNVIHNQKISVDVIE